MKKLWSVWFAKDVGFIDVEAESAVEARRLAEDLQFTDNEKFESILNRTEDEEEWAYCPCMIEEGNEGL